MLFSYGHVKYKLSIQCYISLMGYKYYGIVVGVSPYTYEVADSNLPNDTVVYFQILPFIYCSKLFSLYCVGYIYHADFCTSVQIWKHGLMSWFEWMAFIKLYVTFEHDDRETFLIKREASFYNTFAKLVLSTLPFFSMYTRKQNE